MSKANVLILGDIAPTNGRSKRRSRLKISHLVGTLGRDATICGDFIAANAPYLNKGWVGNSLILQCQKCGQLIEVWCPGGDTDVSKTTWHWTKEEAKWMGGVILQ